MVTSPKTQQKNEAEILKIYMPGGSYKSVKINDGDIAETVCGFVAERCGLAKTLGKHFVMWEKIKDKERKVANTEKLLQTKKAWPLIFGDSGNETNKHCYYFIVLAPGAPSNITSMFPSK